MTSYELITIAISLAGILVTSLVNLACFFYKMGRFEEKLQGFKEDLKTLETKQDKHNGVIERTAINEDKVDSAHHRIDDFNNQLAILNRKFDDLKDILIEKLR